MANINILHRKGKFIQEFNIYCASRGIESSPTLKAMNEFDEGEWKKFLAWVDFRKIHSYEDVISWGWDDEEVSNYFPYEWFIDNPDKEEDIED